MRNGSTSRHPGSHDWRHGVKVWLAFVFSFALLGSLDFGALHVDAQAGSEKKRSVVSAST